MADGELVVFANLLVFISSIGIASGVAQIVEANQPTDNPLLGWQARFFI